MQDCASFLNRKGSIEALWTGDNAEHFGHPCTRLQQSYNAVHGALRCLGEQANSLLKTTYKALRRYCGCPWRLGDIVAAALVLLHHEHQHTT